MKKVSFKSAGFMIRISAVLISLVSISACVLSEVDVPVVDRYSGQRSLSTTEGQSSHALSEQSSVISAEAERYTPPVEVPHYHEGQYTPSVLSRPVPVISEVVRSDRSSRVERLSVGNRVGGEGQQKEVRVITLASGLESTERSEGEGLKGGKQSIELPVKNVSNRKNASKIEIQDVKKTPYIVKQGDTLMSVARDSNMDYRLLAKLNDLKSPYIIHPGQRLNLLTSVNKPITYPNGVLYDHRIGTENRVLENGYKKFIDDEKTILKKGGKSESNKVNLYWVWPADGKIISGFHSSNNRQAPGVNKGLDIAGKLGQPVFAAADGKVVYSGQGLPGYGNLIIINHSDQLLSAYGHNRKLLVTEGDLVKAGEQIAEIGSTGTVSNQLHFEIRKEGDPVDPMLYLPNRAMGHKNREGVL